MRLRVLVAVLALLAAPASQAFLLVGEDPSGDGNHSVLGAVDVGGTVSSARTDILGLDVAEEGGDLTLRLRIAEAPAGTGGYMYRTVFEAGGDLYWTCWTVQWVGGQASEENIKGCSRFTEGTQVGPATTAEGVVLGDEPSVQWTVPRSSVGGAGMTDLQNVFTETWFRGGSTCCVGSDVDSQYHWGRSDMGPDEGVWSLVVPAASEANATAALNVTLGEVDPLLVPPGGNRTATLAVNATGVGNLTFAMEGVLANWTVDIEPANLTAPANTTLTVRVSVPAQARSGSTFEMTLVARLDNTTLASVPLVVEVDYPLQEEWDEGPDLSGDADTPGPGVLPALAAVGAVALLRRRR